MKTITRKHTALATVIMGVSICFSLCLEANAAKSDSHQKAAPKATESEWLTEYFGEKLVKADGSTVSVDTLAGKTIGIYFSAHWCPPCRGFTPVLVKTYNAIVEAGKPFEIVFASSDRSKKAMAGYMTEMSMPWVAIPFGSENKGKLSKKYGIRGIPSLVIIDPNGELISKNARGDVSRKGAAAFDAWQQ